METTYQKIRDLHPCKRGWKNLLWWETPTDLEEKVSLTHILMTNDIEDAIWALPAFDYFSCKLLVLDLVDMVIPIFERSFCDDRLRRIAADARRFYMKGIDSNVSPEEKEVFDQIDSMLENNLMKRNINKNPSLISHNLSYNAYMTLRRLLEADESDRRFVCTALSSFCNMASTDTSGLVSMAIKDSGKYK